MPRSFSIIKQYTESYKSYKWFIWALEKYNNNNFWVMKKNKIIIKNKLITYWFPDKQLLSCSYISNPCWRSFIQMLIILMAARYSQYHIIMGFYIGFYIDYVHTDICEQAVITCWLSAIEMLITQIQAHSPQTANIYENWWRRKKEMFFVLKVR